MSHSWYVCNTKNRTCFELGSAIMTDDFEALCRMTCLGGLIFEDFMTLADDRMLVFEKHKIRQLYEYLITIPPNHFRWSSHEDDLLERVFDSLNNNEPVEQVGSLYSNCDTWTFNKHSIN